MTATTPLPAADRSRPIQLELDQEWCDQCSLDLDVEPGMAQDIVSIRVLPTDEGRLSFLELACDHRIAAENIMMMFYQASLFDADLASLAG